MLKYCPFIILLIISIKIFGATVEELQEVQLSKAELALADGDEKKALKLIKGNLRSDSLHVPSFKFLIDYYLNKGNIQQAFKIYHYLVGKFHTKNVYKLRYDKNMMKYFRDLPAPKNEALKIYQEIAFQYYALYERRGFEESFQKRLLALAEKYFKICQYYRYDLSTTTLYLGKIQSEKELYPDALRSYMESKELFKEEFKLKDDKGLEEIDYLIATTLLQSGLLDSANIYLRSIFTNLATPDSLREVASEYLKALNSNFVSVSAGYFVKENSNVYDLNEEELSNYSVLENELGPSSGLINVFNFNAFGNVTNIANHWNSLFLFNFAQDSYVETKQQTQDTRAFSAGLEAKYTNFEKAIFKFRYNYTKSFNKPSVDGGYEAFSQTHSVEPIYTYTIKSGSLSYSIPFTLTSFETGESITSKGLAINYNPFSYRKFWSPSYSLQYLLNDEIESNIDASTQLNFSVTNSITYSQKISTFQTFSYTKSSNDTNLTQEYDFNEYYFLASINYLPQFKKYFTGLSLLGNIDYRLRSEANGLNTETITYSFGLNYTF